MEWKGLIMMSTKPSRILSEGKSEKKVVWRLDLGQLIKGKARLIQRLGPGSIRAAVSSESVEEEKGKILKQNTSYSGAQNEKLIETFILRQN